ncbi:MAG: hypothetical protein NT027_17685 [Proteobacteria bacterium]|nr:hypothetical protein [Pseudomonadota bacterium]
MKHKLILVLGVGLTHGSFTSCKPRQSSSLTAKESFSDTLPYTGNAPFKLVFIHHPGPNFNWNEDVSKSDPSNSRLDRIEQVIHVGVARALFPIYGQITGNKTGCEPGASLDFMGSVSKLHASLLKEVKSIETVPDLKFPHVHDTWLIPWPQEEKDGFYSNEKLSASSTEIANILSINPGSESFYKKSTESIKKLQASDFKNSESPFFLLGIRSFIFLNPGSSKITFRVLLGLKPATKPFDQTNESVKLSQLIVPEIKERGIVSSFRFEIPLNEKETPMMYVEFGDFDRIEDGDFKINPTGQAKASPRLAGNVNKTGLSKVKVDFNFARIAFNLRQLQITSLDSLLKPGFDIGKVSFRSFAMNIDSVDKQFQNEINSTIDTEVINTASSQANQATAGVINKELVTKFFHVLFDREVSK